MASEYDPSDFVDSEFQASRKTPYTSTQATPPPGPTASPATGRPPTREEVDFKVTEAQSRLAELKRAQEELERERAQLEDLRRRQIEFQTGREEMLHQLTRGVGLLKEAEFNARRDAEQMARALVDMQQALNQVQQIQEQHWTQENFNLELTRALTTIENARMEWNGSRLKFPVLEGAAALPVEADGTRPLHPLLASQNIGQLCKVGLALTWPIAVVMVVIVLLLISLIFRR